MTNNTLFALIPIINVLKATKRQMLSWHNATNNNAGTYRIVSTDRVRVIFGVPRLKWKTLNRKEEKGD